MEVIKLIGVLIVIVGFILKLDTLAVVVVAGLATGLVAGMSPMQILDTLGTAFITNRTATLFILTLPAIGLCERNGLKDKAVDFITSLKNATTGRLIAIWQIIRTVASAFSLRIGGHPQFIRPLINPMAQAAAEVQYGELDEKTQDEIKGMCAGSENYGNFFAQNCFMGASGTLLIVSTLTEQGYPVDALQIAGQSVPIAVLSVVVGVIYALLFDQILKRRFADRKKQEGKYYDLDRKYHYCRVFLLHHRPFLRFQRREGIKRPGLREKAYHRAVLVHPGIHLHRRSLSSTLDHRCLRGPDGSAHRLPSGCPV